MHWSTNAAFDASQPFGKWAEFLASAFVRLEPRQVAEQPFEGTIVRTDVASVKVSRVEATKHCVQRLASHIAQAQDDVCFVNLQLDGVGCYTQRGHAQVCGPGDMAVVDAGVPFEILNRSDFKLFCFALPRASLDPDLLRRPRLKLSASLAGRALSRTVAGYAELCVCAPSSQLIAEFGPAHIAELIAEAPRVLAERPAPRIKSSVVLAMMLDHVDGHFENAGLDAGALAARFGCSKRYVYKVFAEHGRSLGDHIAHLRLTRCGRDLSDAGLQRKSIADIAFEAGFRDISHFNRLFRRHFEVSPREFRRALAPVRAHLA